MAKAKTSARRRGATGRAAGPKASVPKGKLEVSSPRRDSGAGVKLPRPVAKSTRRKAAAQIPGEKAVERTSRTVPVEPETSTPGEEEPMSPIAVDRRREVVGTDDRRRRRGR